MPMRIYAKAILAIAAMNFCAPLFGGAEGVHYAVCVGVNEYDAKYVPSNNWLNGCVSDACNIWTNITSRGEWTDKTAITLLDSGATKDAIRSAITNVAAVAKAGDVFLYSHSSHGGNYGTNGGKDVCICAYDEDYRDSELAADLAKFKSGVKVVVMVDACHSGGLFKSKGGTRSAASFDIAGQVGAYIDLIRKNEGRVRGLKSKGISSSEIGWITAADYDQYSWDSYNGGAFTGAVIEGWHQGFCDDRTYGDEDNYANFYELWNYAKDIAVGYGEPGTEDYTEAQCANTDVLASVVAGWIGDKRPEPDDPPRLRNIADVRVDGGETASFYIRAFAPTNAPAVLSIAGGDGSATLVDGVFSFTPKTKGNYRFVVSARNAFGTASKGFYVVALTDADAGIPVPVWSEDPKKFAVCVGINRYNQWWIPTLSGCVNDAKYMAGNLVGRGGWDTNDVVVLTDKQATKSAIRNAITNIAAQAKAGDTFIYQHSSHGGQFNATDDDVDPLTGEEGKDVFLCVYDEDYTNNATAYNDWEIAEDLAKFPSGVKVAVIVDACHSGGLFKSSEAAKASAGSFDLAGSVSKIIDSKRSSRKARGEDVSLTLSADEIGWATAAEYYEYSYDGGFYHTDKWMTDPRYGGEYWVYYRPGGVFLASATWGLWSGEADTDPDAGDNDGLCDVYEFWKKGYDFCSKISEFWYLDPDYNYYPQCTNITVLQSIELGWTVSEDVYPEIAQTASSETIASVLAGSADDAVVEHVTDASAYSAFRDWASTVKPASEKKSRDGSPAGAEAVRGSKHAWISFALGSDTLLGGDLKDGDLHVAAFERREDEEGEFYYLEATVDGVSIGSSEAVPTDQMLKNMSQIFWIEGAATPDVSTFSFDAVDAWTYNPADGRARLGVAPKSASGSFFFNVHLDND